MPIRIPDNLPATAVLQDENIFVMTVKRAFHQDIRPLKILLLNIMPTKITTETQLLRLLGNTPIQVDITLLRITNHVSKNTPAEHLNEFYKTFDEINDRKFDGMIITGAPVENLDYTDVTYWDELTRIMDWSRTNVFSTLHICWGAQAGLYHHFGIPKYALPEKMFGVFKHTVVSRKIKLFRGFDDVFYVPHSRHTEIRREDIEKVPSLKVVSSSEQSGVYIVMDSEGRQIFITGHSEYDPLTLKNEYERDRAKGLDIKVPENYFPDDDPSMEPCVRWRSHSNLLFSNWLNYYVYQETPFNIENIGDRRE